MKIVFVSPYFRDQITGGGEKHLFDLALTLTDSHRVYIAIPKPKNLFHDQEKSELAKYQQVYQRFVGSNLSNLSFIFTPLMTAAPSWQKLWWTKQFDYLFAVTDGSLFFSLAKYNNLHIQVPLNRGSLSIVEKLKLRNWQYINTNSNFTKQVVEKQWQLPVTHVLHPAVDCQKLASQVKERSGIVSVGRFFAHAHNKRQDVLISALRELITVLPSKMTQTDCQLTLIGSVEDRQLLAKLRRQAHQLPVNFHLDVDRQSLVSALQKAKLFWHAAGFGIDDQQKPELVEHFGIATLEAMAAGALPLVYLAGGQTEVLGNSLKWLGWRDQAELISKSAELLQDEELCQHWQAKTLHRATQFNLSHLRQHLLEMIPS